MSDCTTALEESISIPTLLIIFSATFKSCLNNRFLFHFCVYVLAWLVIKIYARCKEEVFWLGGTFAPLCVTMGFHSFALPWFCWLVLFSQIWVASGPLLEWRDLGKHWLFVPELLVLLLKFPCACLDLCPARALSSSWAGKQHCSCTAALWALTATSPPGQVSWSLDWLSWSFSQSTGLGYLDFLLSPDYLPGVAAHNGAMWESRGNWAHLVCFFFFGSDKILWFFSPHFWFKLSKFLLEWTVWPQERVLSVLLSYAAFSWIFFFFWNICLKCLVLFRGTISRIMHARQHEGFKSRTFVTSANGVWLREEFDLGVLVLYLSVLLLSISFASA